MIEIVQAGQAGKTSLLFDMHRLRARVFKDMLKWDVNVNDDGLEIDDFDLPDAVYILALSEDRRVIGSWRLLPTTGPTMIRDVWPQFLKSLPMPVASNIYEVSRFSVNSLNPDSRANKAESQQAVGEMFVALTALCMKAGIDEIHTLYDDRIAKVIAKIDCAPYASSERLPIDGMMCQTGAFQTNQQMLDRLKAVTGVDASVIDGIDLPPALKARIK